MAAERNDRSRPYYAVTSRPDLQSCAALVFCWRGAGGTFAGLCSDSAKTGAKKHNSILRQALYRRASNAWHWDRDRRRLRTA
jgi:hypothetical protein